MNSTNYDIYSFLFPKFPEYSLAIYIGAKLNTIKTSYTNAYS